MTKYILFTDNKYQTALRIFVTLVVGYLLWSSALAVYGYFPLQPSTTVLGFEFKEPHISITFLRLMMATVTVLSITIVPVLFIWAKVEDRYFTGQKNDLGESS